MEIIKKQFKFVPNKDFYMCLLLTSTVKDLGFFDAIQPYNYYYDYYDLDLDGIGIDNLL